jgi:protein TonB
MPITQTARIPAKCIVHDEPARIVEAAAADYPPLAQMAGLHGTAVIRLDLTDTGHIAHASVMTSSGSDILDRAALEAVDATSYAPETQSCTPVAGTYAVEVDFPA